MSPRRLVLTATAMGLVAVALTALTPRVGDMTEALTAAQRTADTAGADALVIAAAGLLAWAVWAWGALGLVLTAASALPGLVGSAARLATQVVLPAGARRSAALLLGVGLGVAAPVVTTVTDLGPSAVAAVPAAGVPDWPAAPSPGVSATTAATDPVPARRLLGPRRRGLARGGAWRLPLAHRRHMAARAVRGAADRQGDRPGGARVVVGQRRRDRSGPRPPAPGPAPARAGPGVSTALPSRPPPPPDRRSGG
jgi:hypothetical protein